MASHPWVKALHIGFVNSGTAGLVERPRSLINLATASRLVVKPR